MNKLFTCLMFICSLFFLGGCDPDEDYSGDEVHKLDTEQFYEENRIWNSSDIQNYSYKLAVYIDSTASGKKSLYADIVVSGNNSVVTFTSSGGNVITDENSVYCLKTIEDVYEFIFDLYMQEQRLIFDDSIGQYSIDWNIKYDKKYHFPAYLSHFPIHCYQKADDIRIYVKDFTVTD